MPQGAHTLLTVLVDGETKTGKGAASKAIADSLRAAGFNVYYDVAGDFYRRYVALVRQELGLTDEDVLPTGEVLERAARVVHERRLAFEPDANLGDLQRPAISKSVSVLGELSIAQQAGAEWWAISLQKAVMTKADVFVVDGRNPRDRVRDALEIEPLDVQTALDLYMKCEPAEAARRNLLLSGNTSPTSAEIEEERVHVAERRQRDRERAERPFIIPTMSIEFAPKHMTATDVLDRAWQPQDEQELPVTITLDNTHITKSDMLAAVNELALLAVRRQR